MQEQKSSTNSAGNIVKWVAISVTIITVVVSNIVAADVRNQNRDSAMREDYSIKHESQQREISSTQADVREIKTAQAYMQKNIEYIRSEQKQGFEDIKALVKAMTAS